MFGGSLRLYRRVVKPVRPLHGLFYGLGSGTLAVVSRAIGFHTNAADPLWWRWALMTGSHEPASRALFAEIVAPGMTVIDVGAHIGYYTTQFARLVGAGGRVVAFEPHPVNFALLARNVARCGNVTLVNKAVVDRAGTVTLFDDMPDTGGPSLRHDDDRARQVGKLAAAGELAPRVATVPPGGPFEIAAVRLDEALAELGIDRVDVVKMDIEGAEMGALRGLEGLLGSSPGPDIVLELYPAALRPFDVDPLSLWQWLRRHGFTVARICAGGGLEALADEDAARRLVAALDHTGSEANLLARRPGGAAGGA